MVAEPAAPNVAAADAPEGVAASDAYDNVNVVISAQEAELMQQ